MSEIKEYKLKDIGCNFLSGYAFKSTDYTQSGVPLIKIGNIQNRLVEVANDGDFVSDSLIDKTITKYLLSDGDVLIAMTGQGSVGRVGKLKLRNDEKPLLNQRVGKFICDEKNLNTDYLYYVLTTEKYQDLLFNTGSGSGQPNLSPESILDVEIPAPKYSKQIEIAEILLSIDDKIELQQRQNKTLEQLAETVFTNTFIENVDYNWPERTLFDSIELVGGGTPKTENPEYWNGEIKWLSGGDIASNHKNFVTASEKTITMSGVDNSSAKLLPQFSTVISARGTVGKYCLLSEPMTFSQSNYGIKPRYEGCYFFTYLLVAHSVDGLLTAAYGSVFDTITTSTFKGHKVRLPSEDMILDFEKSITPCFEKMLTNQTQIKSLTQLRNALLPKLISGEVSINTV